MNTVHPELAGMLDYSQYRTEVFEWSSVQTSPMTTGAGAVRAGRTQYWHVVPNFMLNVHDGVVDTNLVLPLGPDRCRVVFDFYFAESGPAADAQFRADSMNLAHQVQLEDAGICEEVQQGLPAERSTPGASASSAKRRAIIFIANWLGCFQPRVIEHGRLTLCL